MTPPINIDGDTVEAITMDGTSVSEVTVDGDTVFGAIPDSVVSYYKFNDNSDTTVAIDSVGSNDGTINGPTYTTAAIEGDNSLQYDRSDDFVNLGNDSSFDYNGSAVSLSIGINTTNTSDKMTLWNSRDGSTRESWQNLNINSDGTLAVALRDGDGNILGSSTSSAPGVRDGNDHFITAAIDDGNNVRFYVDGSLFEEVSFGSANAFSQVTDIYLGRRLDGPLPFDGILDVASYADSQLTLGEHQELMP